MQQSDSINEIAAALSKAQAEIEGAKKDAKNPFFKSSYADLSSVIAAIKEPLAKHGLSVVQLTGIGVSGHATLYTQISHTSGQWMRGEIPLNAKDPLDPQKMGSVITYFRRYALQAALCVSAEDDDGDSASAPKQQKPSAQAATPPLQTKENHDPISEQQRKAIYAISKDLGYGDEIMKALMKERFSVYSSKDLSFVQAHELIKMLKSKQAKREPGEEG